MNNTQKLTEHNNATEKDVSRHKGGTNFHSGDEILAYDIGYVEGWNACIDEINKYNEYWRLI